jgi:(1->4)-alpha-D-glucan 1-alpha-D-glucosylmutase
VSGPHRDHVIAYARRRGGDAVIVAVAKSFAGFSQGGRAWPRPENYDASLHVGGYAVEGFADADASQLRISDVFRHLSAAVLKARVVSAETPARKQAHLSSV